MSTSHILRQTIQCRSFPKRYMASKASAPKSQPQSPLPPAKMRALISLYHQAESFVTPENLSARIDQAFIKPAHQMLSRRISLRDLRAEVTERRKAPRISDWDDEAARPTRRATLEAGVDLEITAHWSDSKHPRERRVIEALYGVETNRAMLVMPGLEVLEENAERIQKGFKEDMLRASRQRKS